MKAMPRLLPNYRARGFTLLEVLIALAIVALSAGALLGSVTSSASNVIYLKERTLAEWVALNRLTEIRMDINMPSVGKRKGNTVMAGSRWEWEEEVSELAFEGMFRIDVRAHDTGEAVDDTKPTEQSKEQSTTKSTASGTESDKIPWTATVSGVMSSSRTQLRTPVAVPWHVDPTNPGGGPGGPGGPGAQPRGGEPAPAKPGPSPVN
jgi:general secretion pathway protein I